CAANEFSRDIATGNFQYTGTALQHIKTRGTIFNFSRRTWNGHSTCHFRTDGYKTPFVFPALYRRMGNQLSLAVITHGMAKKAGAAEDFSAHQTPRCQPGIFEKSATVPVASRMAFKSARRLAGIAASSSLTRTSSKNLSTGARSVDSACMAERKSSPAIAFAAS